jgi:hypothetical protein
VAEGRGWLTFSHPHLSAAFLDYTHDAGVRDGRSDMLGSVIDLLCVEKNDDETWSSVQLQNNASNLKLLVISSLVVHLDLEGVYLKKLGAALRLVVGVCTFGRSMQIFDQLGVCVRCEVVLMASMERRTLARRPYSSRSNHNFASFRLVLTDSRYSLPCRPIDMLI